MLELKPLDDHNFHHFISLLKERGEAPEDYYRWKYLDQPAHGHPTGFIAYLDSEPIGCIGIINRSYCSEEGKELPVTWFADWFLTKRSRGKGVGKLLMENVRMVAPYNFGIPGPVLAQKVCSSAGYKPMSGIVEAIYYLRPFTCGYYRGNGSYLKRLLRGLKYFATTFFWTLILAFKKPATFSKSEHRINDIVEISKLYSTALPTLQRNEEFINWISLMPTNPKSKRYWWTIYGNGFVCWGFTEKDFWGLTKAQIFDVVSINNTKDNISEVCKTLKLKGIDLVKCIIHGQNAHVGTTEVHALPVYYCGRELPKMFYLAGLDKESSWREFTLT